MCSTTWAVHRRTLPPFRIERREDRFGIVVPYTQSGYTLASEGMALWSALTCKATLRCVPVTRTHSLASKRRERRLRLLQPKPHVHLSEHLRSIAQVLTGLHGVARLRE